ncbi:hypothetical protein IWW36_002032 [Coemansia brasiliensis]|uniref:Acyltransferase n=1 Tax=Coemansia brasiliensis TaxID=2650707 RepID=A0A9W8IFN4_9FUNG|nr:hypothetical protein IWW36_002032 [Coemansia brasiliensis]
MESFMKNIQSQTYVLNGWDFICSFSNIPFTFFYKNPNNDRSAPFMPSDQLHKSFLRTLQDFPILAGHLVVDGRGYIVVDKNNLNMPEYIESQSPINYEFVEAARFNWDALPIQPSTVPAIPSKNADGKIKLINVHVVRFRNNSGIALFVNMPHYVVDGIGYSAFMKRWAEVNKWMQGNCTAQLPHREYTFDRAVLESAMPEIIPPLSNSCSRIYKTKTLLGYFLSWLSPETRGSLLVEGNKLFSASGHVFYVTKNAIDKIRQQVTCDGQRLSDNDILTTMISHTVAKGFYDAQNNAGIIKSTTRSLMSSFLAPGEFLSLMTMDIRPRLKKLSQQTTQYLGGCITGLPIFNTINRLAQAGSSTAAFGSSCSLVRKAVNDLDEKYVGAVDSVIRGSNCYAHSLALAVTTREKLIVTNQTRFGLYDCDFGIGAPKWVGPMPTFLTNYSSILPTNPLDNQGYYVYMSLEKYLMESVLQNEFWSTHTSFVF